MKLGETLVSVWRQALAEGKGVFREIVVPERIVYSDLLTDAEGNAVSASHYGMPADWPAETLVTVTFADIDGKTKLILKHAGTPSVAEGGWNESLDSLAEYLAKG